MNLIHFGFFSENLRQLFWLHCEHMKIMYVNCGLRNEYESDPARSWLVSSVDKTLHRYRKGEKEKKKEKKETLLTHHNTFTVNLLAFL